MMEYYFETIPREEQARERAKARELRQSQWWRQQVGPGICYHCGGKFPAKALTMDHLIPLSRGGKSNKKNCVPCCKQCNNEKGYRTRAELELKAIDNP